MKYLKKFESLDNLVDKLQKFTEENLSYLKDIGFTISVVKNGNFYYEVDISRIGEIGFYDIYDIFKWEEVKYDFIPYFIMLSKNYIIYNSTSVIFSKLDTRRKSSNYAGHPQSSSEVWVKEEDILDDSISNDLRKSELIHIKIRIITERV